MSAEENQNNYKNADEVDNCTEKDPLQEDFQEEKLKEKSPFIENCSYVIRNITVEPTMFFFVMAVIINGLTSQNLSLEKACRVNLNFSSEICDSLKVQSMESQNQYEKEVQRLVTQAMAWKIYISASITCILALFIGSYSDKTGLRKIFLVYALTGQFLISINGIINTYFLLDLPLEVFVIADAVIEAVSGSWCVCLMTMFAYISAITTNKERTFRMGMINFSLTVGFPIGMGSSGVLLKNIGYYGCFSLVGCIHIGNICYNVFVLKDPERTNEQRKHDGKGIFYFVRIFFDFRNIIETIKVVFKKGTNNRRLRICVMLVVVAILFGPMHGELSIMYILTRYRFNWDEIKFSIFQTYNFITHTIGTIFSITVFSKYLQWHDSILGIISTTSKIAASFVYCFAPNEKIFYIAPLVDILNGTSLLAMRSLVSKMVSPDEFGKVNSIFALVENLMPLVYVPMYTKVYVATMEVLPGAVFLLGSAMTIPAVIVFIWMFWEHRKQLRKTIQNGFDKTF